MPIVPFKLNQDRRHHIPRQRRKVTNWPAYDASLRQRGSAGCNHKALYATQLLSTSQPIRAPR